jgi:ABC-type transport system involved in multi-copper enzyme maturation permease subunit
MFTALYVKEWREKALIFFFELGVLVTLLGAPFLFRDKGEVQEWLVYAILLLFFPFAALILGAAGFETEFRRDAWAYLFSRPVSRPAIWLAKFGALLSMLAALWFVFYVAWAFLPSVAELAKLPGFVFPTFDLGSVFPWWSLGLSLFLLTVAFSLSLLRGRQFNILVVALILGLLFPAVLWALVVSRTGGFMAWLVPARAFRTLLTGLVLTTLAFAGASLLTLKRSDVSQPRKQLSTFVGWFAAFIALAATVTAGSALFVPVPGERHLDFIGSADGQAFYATERGLFSYDAASGRVRWLSKRRNLQFWMSSISAGRLAYAVYDIKGSRDAAPEIWVTNTDGTGRRRLVGRDTPGAWPPDDSVGSLGLSPDGRTVAVLTENVSRREKFRWWTTSTLWTVNADGSGLEKRSLEALFPDGPEESLYLTIAAWAREGKVLIILKRYSREPVRWDIWAYDLDRRTATKVRDDAVPVSWWPLNPKSRDILAVRHRRGDEQGTLALLNLASGEETEIAGGGNITVRWDPNEEKLLFVDRRKGPEGPESLVLTVYSLAAGKAIAERTLTDLDNIYYSYWTSWMPDGRSLLALDRQGRSLRILGPDLDDAGRIDLPARIQKPSGLVIVGDKVLLTGSSKKSYRGSLWRFDLVKKSWKRLY